MSEELENKLNELQETFNDYKRIINDPDMYAWDLFEHVRSQIDIAYHKKLISLKTLEKQQHTTQLQEAWLKQIEKVQKFQYESKFSLLNRTETATSITKEQIYQHFKQKEKNVNELIHKINSITAKSDKLIAQIIREIELNISNVYFNGIVKREQTFMANKTLYFFNWQDDYMFRNLTNNISFGKLIIVTNKYIDKRTINSIFNRETQIELKTENELNALRLKHLLEDERTQNEPIDEINLSEMEINLNDCRVITLECGLFDSISQTLTHINLKSNSLKSLSPDLFKNLNQLTYLNLSFNKLNSLDKNIFVGLVNLKELNMSCNDLKILARHSTLFHGLKNLQILNLDHNKLKTIESNLFHDLVSLKEITLADNSIEDIASNVFSGHGLDNLESINLDCNSLTHLNDIFIGLTKLKRVSVAYNQLTTINNKTFNGLINLTQINLDSNRLKCLKSDLFSGLVRLKEIHLYNNQLEFIQGTQFNGLINLECIDLDGNKLHNLVASLFKGLCNLKKINLSNNLIRHISNDVFTGLIHLIEINLSFNKICYICDKTFVGLNSLEVLRLEHNCLKNFDKNSYKGLTKLRELDLDDNPLLI